MDSLLLWRSLDHLVRERVIIPGGDAGDVDITAHGDDSFTASILGALAIVAVGPRHFDVRGPVPDFDPVTVARLVRCHSARELAVLDCMYRPDDVPEDREDCLHLGDRARIAAWLAGPGVPSAWPGIASSDHEQVLRSYAAWRMRRVLGAMLRAAGDVDRAVTREATAA